MSESDSVGLSTESQNEAAPASKGTVDDFQHYCRSLGVGGLLAHDADLMWVVQQAFQAPLPRSWTEYVDDEGRVYFFNLVTEQSTWEHPLDGIYRELIEFIVQVRKAVPTQEQRAQVVNQHLVDAHGKALSDLEHWSGPYQSETGSYYYNDELHVSTWVSPVEDMEFELLIRQSVLYQCLLADHSSVAAAPTAQLKAPAEALLPELQLPLREAHHSETACPDSSRSFHTAKESSRSATSRSVGSARSGRSVAEVTSRVSKAVGSVRADSMARAESAASDGNTLEVTFGCTAPMQVPVMEMR
mmetsp:Transcript_44293/g.102313  ORF Transcript_44293/g.102313 Transcript_44293/m.102313 type:complete len:301 (+) Transcript_44293:3-905(+)